ncbi:MAG: bifunctional hydroxymethylpyrimidine kinase/phosphomethylpyrimidine kinase [Nitrospiraceae bacterium]|jgi:hydroxymethylpyrimidine/phosphomethylpyrimidine kinase|nr:MAG: bifunctional hydroxymethylpyrimidine kinase/phosphomethylpyrimidine kinase [Nitrospiraceae bacterium]
MKKALTVAGFDPTGGAGIQADLKVFHALDIYGLSVVSALTAQNTDGVKAVMSVPDRFLKKQLTVLLSDLVPEATKTGMLYSESNVAVVAEMIKKHSLKNIVADPVIISSSGKKLVETNTPSAIRKKIFPLCTVITPNIHEASVLTGIDIKDRTDMEKAAVRLKAYGPENVIITGGHLEDVALDIFYNGEFHYLKGRKKKGEYHGTGCTFSAALTALLAKGYSVLDAAREAKKFMNTAFRKTFNAGGKMRLFRL